MNECAWCDMECGRYLLCTPCGNDLNRRLQRYAAGDRDLNNAELAAELGIPLTTVEQRLSRLGLTR